jgi:probable rRNA maturation factor
MILIEPPRSPTVARRYPLNQRELSQFAGRAVRAAGVRGTISVLLTGDDRIRELNRQFRKKNTATDVLSFPAIEWEAGNGPKNRSAGDLAISLDTAGRQAEAFGHSLATEVKVLILHGALHLAGYDHEADSGEMARLEAKLRKEFGLPAGLIQRSSSAKRPTTAPAAKQTPQKSGSSQR